MVNKHRYRAEIKHIVGEEHITAQEIFVALQKLYPQIGIGTVYRNLQEMVDEGELLKTTGVLDQAIYEKIKPTHGHIVCKKSNRVVDVDVSGLDLSQLNLPDDFTVHNLHISAVGSFGDADESCKISIQQTATR